MRGSPLNKNVVENLQSLLNQWDGDETSSQGRQLLEMIHPDYSLHDNGVLTVSGVPELVQRMRSLREEDPSFSQEVIASIEENDIVVFRWLATSDQHKPFSGMTWARFSDEKLMEVHQYWVQPHFQSWVSK